MAYSNGVSAGPSPYDALQYQQLLAAQQAAGASQTTGSATGTTGSTFSVQSSNTSSSPNASSSTSSNVTGLGSMLSSQLSSILMQLQSVTGQSGSASTLSQSSSSQSTDPLGQLMNADAGNSNAPISQADFEKAFAGGQNTAKADQVFAKLDKNGDGTIDQSEAQAAVQKTQHGHGHHHHGGASGQDPLSTNSSSNSDSSQSTDPLAQLLNTDVNGTSSATSNGQISKSDFEKAFAEGQNTAQADQIFTKIDKNGDGTIDQSEAQNALKHLQHAQEARGMQSPFGIMSNSGGQSSTALPTMNSASTLFFAQLQGQAA